MSVPIDHATIYFEVALPSAIMGEEGAQLGQAAAEKVQRMDPTNLQSGWTFPIGPDNPTQQEQLQQVNTRLATLAGDERARGVLPEASSGLFYCFAEQSIICYTWVPTIRTEPSSDRAWGGPLGPSSDIALIQKTFCMPMLAVYAFARAI